MGGTANGRRSAKCTSFSLKICCSFTVLIYVPQAKPFTCTYFTIPAGIITSYLYSVKSSTTYGTQLENY